METDAIAIPREVGLPKFTEIVSGRDKIQTQALWHSLSSFLFVFL
jgi:hypothetical protein